MVEVHQHASVKVAGPCATGPRMTVGLEVSKLI